MPKSKPDQVIVHRLEFQESERETLNMMAGAWTFDRILNPFIRLINDNTTLVLILTFIAGYLGFKWIPPKVEEGIDIITDFRDQFEAAVEQGTVIRERIDVVGGAIRKGPFWGLIDLVEYYTGTNVPGDAATGGYEPTSSTSTVISSHGGRP